LNCWLRINLNQQTGSTIILKQRAGSDSILGQSPSHRDRTIVIPNHELTAQARGRRVKLQVVNRSIGRHAATAQPTNRFGIAQLQGQH
jgi:hypothetical protein